MTRTQSASLARLVTPSARISSWSRLLTTPLVTVVSGEFVSPRSDVRSTFFYAEVTTARLSAISGVLESGNVIAQVGSVVPLEQARRAHEMLAGAPHRRGKIMLEVAP